ncbi:MAG: hypothetical protein R3B90_08020 [Planctomycetaceae bacterium]
MRVESKKGQQPHPTRNTQHSTLPAVSLSGRDFRFDPNTGAFEAITGVGQFGMAFDEVGNRYLCDNRHPCQQVLVEDWQLRRNPKVSIARVMHDVLPAGESSRLFPISRTWTTSNLHANQFTAACGLCIYRGHALPNTMYGDAFICDPTANLVHHGDVVDSGSVYGEGPDSREGVEFLATRDEWFRPVNLTVGPDGALYVVDMYRAVIEHPQFMPEELQTRPDLLLGTDRGRIWRVTSRNAPPHSTQLATPLDLTAASIDEHWKLDTTRRILVAEPNRLRAATTSLRDMLQSTRPESRIHAMTLLAVAAELDDAALGAAHRRCGPLGVRSRGADRGTARSDGPADRRLAAGSIEERGERSRPASAMRVEPHGSEGRARTAHRRAGQDTMGHARRRTARRCGRARGSPAEPARDQARERSPPASRMGRP